MSKILYADYYMPAHVISAREIVLKSEIFLTANSQINVSEAADNYIKNLGITEITVENKGNLIDIFSEMLSKMFETTGILPEKITNIFYTSFENYSYNDKVGIPYYLQAKFNLTNAAVMLLNQHCASTLHAVRLADSLSKAQKESYSLILSPSFINENEDRYFDFTMFGDGAGILLVGNDERAEGFKIVDVFSFSDGSVSRLSYDNNETLAAAYPYYFLKTKIVIFKSYTAGLQKIAQVHGEWLQNSRKVVIQSLGNTLSKEFSTMLAIPFEKLYANYYGGHIGDTDIIRNFKELTEEVKFARGDKIALLGFGSDVKSVNAINICCKYE